MAARVISVIPRCSCHRKLATVQGEFELLIASGKTTDEAFKIINRTLLCCRANILCPPAYPVLDANTGVFVDEIGISSYNNVRGKITTRDGPSFYLENSPGFPTNLPSRV